MKSPKILMILTQILLSLFHQPYDGFFYVMEIHAVRYREFLFVFGHVSWVYTEA